MVHSNRRMFQKLKNENSKNVQKKLLAKERNTTKSIRMKFWDPSKKLFLSLDNGLIETISKSEEAFSLSRSNFLNIRDQILNMSYLPLHIMKGKKDIWTMQCPTSIWFVNLGTKKIIGGGRLDKRLNRNEKLIGAYSAHEGRVLCGITNQSRALLMLIRQQKKTKIELVFLEISDFAIQKVTGHGKFGK